jgi:glycosyltransferase involved in cell wall biosynthesis
MRIGILHGWLLSGSGSNVYVQNVAKSLYKLGHEVHVYCQDHEADKLPFVSRILIHTPDAEVEETKLRSDGITVHIPDIGSTLPVFVWDNYPAFESVVEFPKLSFGNLQNYLMSNVKTIAAGVQDYHLDILHANHAIMMPSIARDVSERTGIPYVVALHGSALAYSVKEDPTLFDYAVKGLDGANAILVGNQYFKSEVLDLFQKRCAGLSGKIIEVPLGVNTDLFKPIKEEHRLESISSFLRAGEGHFKGRTAEQSHELRLEAYKWIAHGEIPQSIFELAKQYPQKYADVDLPERISNVDWSIPTIVFVGRLILGKGIQDLLLSYFEVVKKIKCQLLIIGNGPIREWLEAFFLFRKYAISTMFEPWLEVAQEIPDSERMLETSKQWIMETKDTVNPSPEAKVLFTGFLDHKLLRYILPCADIAIFPSIVPESFGLVVLESASSGVIPLVSDFSGLHDNALVFEQEIPELNEGDLRFTINPEKRIYSITDRLENFLTSSISHLKNPLRETCERKFSWNAVITLLTEVYKSIIE